MSFGATRPRRLERREEALPRRERHQGRPLAPPFTLWPFLEDGHRRNHMGPRKAYLTVEMNMGQMVDDVRLAANRPRPRGVPDAREASSPRPMRSWVASESPRGKVGE